MRIRRTSAVLVALALAVAALLSPVAGATTPPGVVDQNTIQTSSGSVIVHDTSWVASVVQPTRTGRMTGFSLVVGNFSGNPSTLGDLTVALAQDNAGAPGPALASEAVPKASISNGVLDVTFAAPPNVTAAATYWLVLSATGGSVTDRYSVRLAPDGNTFVSANHGGAWGNVSTDSHLGFTSYIVDKTTRTLSTQASAGALVGTPVTDTVTIANADNPTGNVTFKLFSNSGCTTQVGSSSVKALVANGPGSATATSDTITPPNAGTYYWTASYAGDTNNNAVPATCGATNESVTITRFSPTMSTQVDSNGAIGQATFDTATLASGSSPGGTIDFTAYGPNDSTCTTVAFTSSVPVNHGNGAYQSATFLPPAAGTYRWIAIYSGDTNNNGRQGTCGDSGEQFTTATPSAGVGGTISDTATISGLGGPAPYGNVTFSAFTNTGCTGTAAFTSTKGVPGNGNVTSDPFTGVPGAGPYTWKVETATDANNNAVTHCGGTNETSTVAAITGGLLHSCAIRATTQCWGSNAQGQTTMPPGPFNAISAGSMHTCAVKTTGALACWGLNNYGQTTAPAGTFSAVSAGYYHSCALSTAGTIACWGYNGNGQASPPSGTFTAISAGAYHSCGIRAGGSLACWGYNAQGQTTAPAGTFTSISLGAYHSCGVRTSGALACWGYNNYGQTAAPAGTFSVVSSGLYHSCALRTTGALACWGYNAQGQTTPPAGTFTALGAGGYHACATKPTNAIACWGYNSNGQATPPP